ncbi:MAG: transcription-repair coupling factor, partial [Spirochaetales bacterium]|nr:transcription-repair coupling factor [Spirochaetales bacterium]
EVDILIGTHRLLQKDVVFKDLGLLIVDEEQRFGVKHKERLKEVKTSIDCLALSATPIPRTLHMSLLKIRDMSLLTTAPYNRHPIETYIREYDEHLVEEAIRKEIERGGQVFYLHNRVETLPQIKRFIESLAPELLVDTAHGQMASHELEDIMHRFIHGGSQVLVATTIIENGIDIPNVNTIIIDRADLYGISQLYQLRGRVGRSERMAFAYLFYPADRALSEIAMKRLQIISDYTDLGSGFKIAMKDMEVRGAGNLLGRQQHGEIASVGFDMYLRILDEAVAELQPEKEETAPDAYLELDYSGYIPDAYISEPVEKMEVYKKIASIQSDNDLEYITGELIDRFGPLPDELHSLMSLAELRIICKKLFISSLQERKGNVRIEFSRVSVINVDKVLHLIKNSGGTVRLDPSNPNVLHMDTEIVGLREKSEFIRDRLNSLV